MLRFSVGALALATLLSTSINSSISAITLEEAEQNFRTRPHQDLATRLGVDETAEFRKHFTAIDRLSSNPREAINYYVDQVIPMLRQFEVIIGHHPLTEARQMIAVGIRTLESIKNAPINLIKSIIENLQPYTREDIHSFFNLLPILSDAIPGARETTKTVFKIRTIFSAGREAFKNVLDTMNSPSVSSSFRSSQTQAPTNAPSVGNWSETFQTNTGSITRRQDGFFEITGSFGGNGSPMSLSLNPTMSRAQVEEQLRSSGLIGNPQRDSSILQANPQPNFVIPKATVQTPSVSRPTAQAAASPSRPAAPAPQQQSQSSTDILEQHTSYNGQNLVVQKADGTSHTFTPENFKIQGGQILLKASRNGTLIDGVSVSTFINNKLLKAPSN